MQLRPPDAEAVMARAICLKYIFVKGLATPPHDYLEKCKSAWNHDEWAKFQESVREQNAQLMERLVRSGLWDGMDEDERNFMQAGPLQLAPQVLIHASWLPEPIACLLWALGYISELPPYDKQSSPEVTNKLPAEAAESLIKRAELRTPELIEKQGSVAELWHWRSRTRELQESGYHFALPKNRTIEEIIELASKKAFEDGMVPTPIGKDFPAFDKAYRDMTDEEFSQVRSIAQERHRAFNWLNGFAPGNRWAETPTDT